MTAVTQTLGRYNTYIGARYVPKFANPLEHDTSRTYESLEIVTYQGASYTSKQSVPLNIPITDTNYWVITGNYNAQVEEYRRETKEVKAQVDGMVADVAEAKAKSSANEIKINDNTTNIANNLAKIQANTNAIANIDQVVASTIKQYDTIAELKQQTDLVVDDVVMTLGYSSKGDGGGNRYYVANALPSQKTADNGRYIHAPLALSGGTDAYLIAIDDEINNYQYGAFSGDITDDLIAICENNNVIKLKEGTYTVTRKVDIEKDVIMNFENVVLNFPSNIDVCLNFKSPLQPQNVGTIANLSRGINQINITNLNQGEILRISSDALFNDVRNYYKEGEFSTVIKSDSSGSILSNRTMASYGRAIIEQFPMINVNLKGKLTVNNKGNTNQTISFKACTGTIEDLTVTASNSPYGILIVNCYRLTFNKVSALQNLASTQGLEYGITIGDSQSIDIRDGLVKGNRHGIACGGGTGNHIVNRLINFKGIADSDISQSADMHGNCEFCSYEGVFQNGLVIGGKNNTVKGSVTQLVNGPAVMLGEICGWHFDLSHLEIRLPNGGTPFRVYTVSGSPSGGVLDLSDSFITGSVSTILELVTGAQQASGRVAIKLNGTMCSQSLSQAVSILSGSSASIHLLDFGGSSMSTTGVSGDATKILRITGMEYEVIK